MNPGGFLLALILAVAGVLILFWAIGRKDKMDTASQLERWRELYRREFGIELGEVIIPKRWLGFGRLIVIAEGLTVRQVLAVLGKYFTIYSSYSDPDGVVTKNERENTSAYAIWVRELVEADEDKANKSAIDIKVAQVATMTLLERLLYELAYFTETGNHLDMQNMTLCSGSRNSGEGVPVVNWLSSNRLHVNWFSNGRSHAFLRAREVVR